MEQLCDQGLDAGMHGMAWPRCGYRSNSGKCEFSTIAHNKLFSHFYLPKLIDDVFLVKVCALEATDNGVHKHSSATATIMQHTIKPLATV